MKKLIFISHANPEDNEFTQWLCLRLVNEGYEVWSDVTRLIGGEPFWTNIESAIRDHTIRFLFVLSRASNNPQRGTIGELQLAKSVAKIECIEDFIIPLRIEDLLHSELNILIHGLYTIDFAQSWAKGLVKLIEKFEKSNMQKDTNKYNPSKVCSWWKTSFDGNNILSTEKEIYLSNWFSIKDLPDIIYIHHFNSVRQSFDRGKNELPFPAFPIRNSLWSFATVSDLELSDAETMSMPTSKFINETDPNSSIDIREGRNAIVYLLRMAWLSYIEFSNLPVYMLANERPCAYFTQEILKSKMTTFDITDFLSGRRYLVGKYKGRFWHFGISADVQLYPILAYIIKPHVLFSDDGVNIWESSNRLHRARRSACKNWWNPQWRDRILTAIYWLAQKLDKNEIIIPIASNLDIAVSIKPLSFESPISYNENLVIESTFEEDENDYDDIESNDEEVGEI